MYFKTLVENIIDNKDIYTVDELKNYVIWETNIKNLPIVRKAIKKDGSYKAGARILVPIFDTPDNEITEKIKELININGEQIIKTIKELRIWAKDNITPERKKELGYKEDDSYIKNSAEPGLGLQIAKTLVEAYSKGLLVAPLDVFKDPTTNVFDNIGNRLDMLNIYIPIQNYKDFKKICEWRNINAYKEYFEYNVDKDVERVWGRALDVL
jgi:hypothetical protein